MNSARLLSIEIIKLGEKLVEIVVPSLVALLKVALLKISLKKKNLMTSQKSKLNKLTLYLIGEDLFSRKDQ